MLKVYSLGALYPEEIAQRFDGERWMDWQQTTLNPAGRNAFIQLIRTPASRRDPGQIASSIAATEPLLNLLDAHLARHAFMAGDTFTMADIPIVCELHRWRSLPINHPGRVHLERWYQDILSRPASQGVLDLSLS